MSEQKPGLSRSANHDRAHTWRRRALRRRLWRRHLNTAIYLARAGIEVAFASALGDDPYSDGILALAAAEGWRVTSCCACRRLPGIDLIDTNVPDRRHVHCWHSEAPARELFELADWGRVAESLLKAKLVYFSGITLSLYSNNGSAASSPSSNWRAAGRQDRLRRQFPPARLEGRSHPHAHGVHGGAQRVDIALPTYDDEAVLWGDPSPEATVARLGAFGIGEIVVKNGPTARWSLPAGRANSFRCRRSWCGRHHGAGDSFNAAYIAARLSGDGPSAAAGAAHRLGGQVIRHRGSIMPPHRDGDALVAYS